MVDCTGLENRQRATVREFESHRLRQNYFDKLLIFKVNTNILPITNQQANIKTTIKSRDAGCMTAFVFLSCHSPSSTQTATAVPVRGGKVTRH